MAWDPNSDPGLAGYVVYFVNASGRYTNRVDVGNVTTNTVTGLAEGTDYFFAVTAYNPSRLESDYSNEISYRLPSTSQATPFDIPDWITNEDVAAGPIEFTVGDLETPAGSLVLSAVSSNPKLVPDAGIIFGGNGSNRTVLIQPATNQFGAATITVMVRDAGGRAAIDTFLLTVNPVNDLPTISRVADQTMNEDDSLSLALALNDAETPPGNLILSVSSSNTGLVPNANILLGGSGLNRSVTITPLPNQNGATTITLTVADAESGSVSESFALTVNSVNDPPTLATPGNVTMNEDAGPQTVNLSGIGSGAPNENQALAVSAVSSNPAVIPAPTVSYTSPSSTGSLTFTPVANANGTALITVTVNDGQSQNNTISRTFTVTVNAVNDPPTLDPLVDLSFAARPGEQTVSLTGISSGAANESQALIVSVTSSDTSIVPAPTLNYASPAATGTISFSPASNAGKATITVTVSDGGASNNIVTRSFAVYVRPTENEAPPTISPIGNRTVNEGASSGPVPFTIADSGTAAELLTVSGASFNPTLVPEENIVFGGNGNDRTVTVTPLPNRSGTAIIAIRVADDNFGSTSTSFVLTVNPVNDLPTISPIADLVLNENSATAVVEFTIGDAETPGNALRVFATSSNPALAPNANIILGGSGAGRALLVTPATNQTGTATITVNVTDGAGASANRAFVVTVNPVNGLPTISDLPDQSIKEDRATAAIPFTVWDGETAASSLALSASSSNPALVPEANIVFAGSGTSRTVTVSPTTNQFGSATLTITVQDGDGGMASDSFEVTVSPVNDEPALDAISDVSMSEGGGTRTIILTGIQSGAPNESQTLSLSAISSNPALIPNPSVEYLSPSASGSLILSPLPGTAGTATITVSVSDGQPQHSLATRAFTVTANALPRISGLLDVLMDEDVADVEIPFAVADVETPAASLIISATASAPELLPADSFRLGGSGANRTLALSPSVNRFGFSWLTVTVTDADGDSTSSTVAVIVKRREGFVTITGISYQAGQAAISFTTVRGSNCIVEYRSLFDGSSWSVLTSIPGDGGTVTVNDDSAPTTGRVYRLRVE